MHTDGVRVEVQLELVGRLGRGPGDGGDQPHGGYENVRVPPLKRTCGCLAIVQCPAQDVPPARPILTGKGAMPSEATN